MGKYNLTILKAINASLLLVLVVTLSACSTLKKTMSTGSKGKVAVLTSPSGKTEKIYSLEKETINTSPKIRNIRFSKKKSICNTKSTSENIILKREEVDYELSFMIDSLNNQRPSVNRKGRKYRRLSKNMMTNLYNTPDCKPFRYKLHVINKLLSGHKLESIEQ